MADKSDSALYRHLAHVKEGNRRFENAFQGVTRMILESTIEKVVVGCWLQRVATWSTSQ